MLSATTECGLGEAFDQLASTLTQRKATGPALIEAVGLVRVAGESRLLDGVHLRAEAGQLVALLGCSGAGKSTLLRALAGCEPLTKGHVLLEGAPLDLATAQTAVAYLPQDDLLHGVLTPRQTLDDAALLRLPTRATAEERRRRVAHSLNVLDLEACQDRPVCDLSGGQRKRVALAVELLSQPGVILLDEPTASLDPALRGRTLDLLRRLADDGRAVIVATHDPVGLDRCDRLVALHAGRVVAAGTPAAVRRRLRIERLEELWERLPSVAASRLVRGRQPTAPPALHRPRSVDWRRGLRHTAALTARELRLLTRDRRRLALITSQAVLIGLAVGAALEATTLVLFMLVLAALWCGTSGGARELVKERALRRQERRAGVGVGPYLAAKVLTQLVLAASQAGLLLGATCLLQDLPGHPVWLYGVLCLTAWVGGLSGLAISSLTRSADRANVLVPLALIPQVLFAGVFATTGDLAQHLGRALPARWAYDLALRTTLTHDPEALVPEGDHTARRGRLERERAEQDARWRALAALTEPLDADDPGTRVEIALDVLRVRRDRAEGRADWARQGLVDLDAQQTELRESCEAQRDRTRRAGQLLLNPYKAWDERPAEQQDMKPSDWFESQRAELRTTQRGLDDLQPQIEAFDALAVESRTRLEEADVARGELRTQALRVDGVWREVKQELLELDRRAQRWQRGAEELAQQVRGMEALRRSLGDDLEDSRVVRLESAGSIRADTSVLAAFGLVFVALAGWRLERARV